MPSKTPRPKLTSRLSLYLNSLCLSLKYQISVEKVSVFTEILQTRNIEQLPVLVSRYEKNISKKIEDSRKKHKRILQIVKKNNFREWLDRCGLEQKIVRLLADRLFDAEVHWERALIKFSEEKSKMLSEEKHCGDQLVNLQLGHSLSIDIRGLRTSVFGCQKK